MGALHRFFIPEVSWDESALFLRGEEAHHCSQVLRHSVGDQVEVFQGRGVSAVARIRSARKFEVELEPLEIRRHAPLAVQVTVAQSILKGKQMDWMVQKAAEIGAARILPLLAERAVVRLEEGERKRENWRRVALEACKQCGQNWLPEVASPQRVPEFLETDRADWRLVAALSPEARRLMDLLGERPAGFDSVSVAIGPEGDFSPGELARFQEAGVGFLSLGPTILRAETAAIYALSVVSQACF